jgi:hypothetical protein
MFQHEFLKFIIIEKIGIKWMNKRIQNQKDQNKINVNALKKHKTNV